MTTSSKAGSSGSAPSITFTLNELIGFTIGWLIIAGIFFFFANKYTQKNIPVKKEIEAVRTQEEKQKASGGKVISYPGARENVKLRTSFTAFEGYWDCDRRPEIVLEYQEGGQLIKKAVAPETVSIKVLTPWSANGYPPGIPTSMKGKHFHNDHVSPQIQVNFTIPESMPVNVEAEVKVIANFRYTVSGEALRYHTESKTAKKSTILNIKTASEARSLGFGEQPATSGKPLKDLENDYKFNEIIRKILSFFMYGSLGFIGLALITFLFQGKKDTQLKA